MFKHHHHHGQESAPIELVVAVIILVASLGLAFIVLQNTQSAQCTDKLKSQMQGLQAVMLDVALGSPSTSRQTNLELSKCGSASIEAIRVVYYDSPSYCGKCGATGGGCWVVEPLAYDFELREYSIMRDATTCINMPGRVKLETDDVLCSDTSLISGSDSSDPGCPVEKKESREGCGLPPDLASASNSQVMTLGKAAGETQYLARVTKAFDTSAGDPVLKVCFARKRGET